MAIPQVSEWLQVNAAGEVEVPTAQLAGANGEKLAVLSSDNFLVGWTEVAISAAGGGSDGGDTAEDIATVFEDEPLTFAPEGEAETTEGSDVAAQPTYSDDQNEMGQAQILLTIGSIAGLVVAIGLWQSRLRRRSSP